VRQPVEWAQVRELVADGLSRREIARRLGMNRRTVARLAQASAPPRYRRQPTGSALDPLEPLMRELLVEWPAIAAPRMTELLREHGYQGSVRVVRRRLAELRPRQVRPAQRTGYAPGQVAQVDWCEMPTRPRLGGRERRVYALLFTLPYSGAQTAHFTLDMTVESFLEGHVVAFGFLGGVPRELVYDNLRAAVARREGREVRWAARFLHLRGHYAFHATACTPQTPREKGSVESGVGYLKSGFWPARRFATLAELDLLYARWRDQVANVRRHGTGRFLVGERLLEERRQLRPLPPGRFDPAGERACRVPLDGYLRHAGAFYRAPLELVHQRVLLRFSRDEVWVEHRGVEVARDPRRYEPGVWLPPPVARPEPPPPAPLRVVRAGLPPPELAPYAELSA
jgi:transposase